MKRGYVCEAILQKKISIEACGIHEGKVTIKIHKPDSTTVYTTKFLSISNIAPGVEYTYDVKWAVSSYATTGTYTYDVYFYYGTSTLMKDDVKDPSNTITIN